MVVRIDGGSQPSHKSKNGTTNRTHGSGSSFYSCERRSQQMEDFETNKVSKNRCCRARSLAGPKTKGSNSLSGPDAGAERDKRQLRNLCEDALQKTTHHPAVEEQNACSHELEPTRLPRISNYSWDGEPFEKTSSSAATWLILPVVICLSQRLSHACLSISIVQRNCRRLIKTVMVYLMVPYYLDNRSNSRANTCTKGRLTKPCIY